MHMDPNRGLLYKNVNSERVLYMKTLYKGPLRGQTVLRTDSAPNAFNVIWERIFLNVFIHSRANTGSALNPRKYVRNQSRDGSSGTISWEMCLRAINKQTYK